MKAFFGKPDSGSRDRETKQDFNPIQQGNNEKDMIELNAEAGSS